MDQAPGQRDRRQLGKGLDHGVGAARVQVQNRQGHEGLLRVESRNHRRRS